VANAPTTTYSAPIIFPTFTDVVESKYFVCWRSISLSRSCIRSRSTSWISFTGERSLIIIEEMPLPRLS